MNLQDCASFINPIAAVISHIVSGPSNSAGALEIHVLAHFKQAEFELPTRASKSLTLFGQTHALDRIVFSIQTPASIVRMRYYMNTGRYRIPVTKRTCLSSSQSSTIDLYIRLSRSSQAEGH